MGRRKPRNTLILFPYHCFSLCTTYVSCQTIMFNVLSPSQKTSKWLPRSLIRTYRKTRRWCSWTWWRYRWNICSLSYWNNRICFRIHLKYRFILTSLGSFTCSLSISQSLFRKNLRRWSYRRKSPRNIYWLGIMDSHYISRHYVYGLDGMFPSRSSFTMGRILE